MSRLFGKLTNRARRLTDKMDQYHEAVTFAEVGQQELIKGLIAKEERIEERPPKLLVVGREATFSREIIDYALEMAARMSYEIMALNTAPLSCESFKLFSFSRNKLCEEFRDISKENVRAFQEEAEKMGISFSHVVKFSEPDEALQEIKREHEDIEFVVSEAEEEQAANRAEEGERPRREMFVYSMV
jgi:gas vesicle protein